MITTLEGITQVAGRSVDVAADIAILIDTFNKLFEDESRNGAIIAEMLVSSNPEGVAKFVDHCTRAMDNVRRMKEEK